MSSKEPAYPTPSEALRTLRSAPGLAVLCLAVGLWFGPGVRAESNENLAIITNEASTPEMRGNAYERLTRIEFAGLVRELAVELGRRSAVGGSGPRSQYPWLEQDLHEIDRIWHTLNQLWQVQIEEARKRGEDLATVWLELLSDESFPQPSTPRLIRELAADLRTEVRLIQEAGTQANPPAFTPPQPRDPSGPPPIPRLTPPAPPPASARLVSWLHAIEQLVRAEGRPVELRRALVPLLFEVGDANACLDVALALAPAAATVAELADAFCRSTPRPLRSRLSPASQQRLWERSVQLLERADAEGERELAAIAVRLARHLDRLLLIEGRDTFEPNDRLPEFRDANGRPNVRFHREIAQRIRSWSGARRDAR